jgi:PilZ domain-containing protein
MSERRRARRTIADGISARVRPGHRVLVVDVSAGGALFEAVRPFRPGADVEVQFERADQRLRIAATVVRCGVTAIDPERGPTYRAAVAFTGTFAWVREEGTLDGHRLPDDEGRRNRIGNRGSK